MVTEISLHVCPICGKEASSNHHIIPRAEGGTDDPRNKVWLCVGCHDIVEGIYDSTGRIYSPSLVRDIQMGILPSLGKGTRKGKVIIVPGEVPWWEISDRAERHRVNSRQLMRMWLKVHPGYAAEARKRYRERHHPLAELVVRLSNLRYKINMGVGG